MNNHTPPSPLIGWHTMLMGVALLASARSKDQRTRNGACIATPDNRIIGVGYNGLPRGCNDNDPIYWMDNDNDPLHSRHSYVVHAEINAILNCVTLPLTNATIYTTQFPCPKCTQAIIQAGIKKIFYLREKTHHERINSTSRKMLKDCGVECKKIDEIDQMTLDWATKFNDFITKN